MEYKFEELVDINKLKVIFNGIYINTGASLPLGLISDSGHILIQSGERDICSKFYNANPLTAGKCIENNKCIIDEVRKRGKFAAHVCKAGLVSIGYPVIIEGQQVAAILHGKFFSHKPDLEYFRKQAKIFGFDEQKYLKAVQDVPVIPEDKVGSQVEFLSNMAKALAQFGCSHLKQIETGEKLKEKMAELTDHQNALEISEERYKLSVECSNDILWDWNLATDTFYLPVKFNDAVNLESLYNNYNGWIKILHPIKSEGFLKIFYPEDTPKMVKLLNGLLSGETSYFEQDCRILTRAGEYIWIQIKGRTIKNGIGKPLRIAGSINNIDEHKKYEEKIKHLAYYDQLTDLPNRILFLKRLREDIHSTGRCHRRGAVFYIDLDNFSAMNNVLKYSFGDMLLQMTGAKLKKCLGRHCMAARVGGDEFTVMLPAKGTLSDIYMTADKLLKIFNEPWTINSHEFNINASIGITTYPDDGTDEETLFRNAHTAMHNAKVSGKNRYLFFQKQMNDAVLQKTYLKADLKKAISENQFEVYYQPLFKIASGSIAGFEALIRWNHPEKGLIQPANFIPTCEESGLIIPIGEWVLKSACHQLKMWQDTGFHKYSISVNVSAVQLQYKDFVKTVRDILKETGLEPEHLGLEITESALMKSIDTAADILKQLKSMGIRCILDDFGTGYSSLNYLRMLPIDMLKIDRSFINELQESGDEAIISAVIMLGHKMRLGVVAEGVENSSQLNFLKKYGCDMVQGFLFGKPLPAKETERLHFS